MSKLASHTPRPRLLRSRGFTLVELLVVVAIIALLVSLLMPSLTRVKELARRTLCATNLHAIGKAWHFYFNENDNKPGALHHPHDELLWGDTLSQWNSFLHTKDWRLGPYYLGGGKLWQAGLLDQPGVFVCPSLERPSGQYYNQQRWAWRYVCPNAWRATLKNFWPPIPTHSSWTTYGRRRNNYYDNPGLASVAGGDHSDDQIQLSYTGVGAVKQPGTFSWMADTFVAPEVALESHVPTVNVLYLDGHVKYWEDKTGKVLYENGLPNWVWKVSGPGAEYNWKHDDIWMIIDGYHLEPLGSGTKGRNW